jgi:hypothetical protein
LEKILLGNGKRDHPDKVDTNKKKKKFGNT